MSSCQNLELLSLFFRSMVKEFVANNDVKQIKRLTIVLAEEFAVSHNSHARKGGLIGLAATAIALGKVGGKDHWTSA